MIYETIDEILREQKNTEFNSKAPSAVFLIGEAAKCLD